LNFERSPSRRRLWHAGALCGALVLAVTLPACTTSESVDFDAMPSGAAGHPSGNGGTTGTPAGGTTGAAGATTGAAGSTSSGAGGQSVAGSTGATGGTTGAAGAKGDAGAAGRGSSGGAGGTTGTSDAGAASDGSTPSITYTNYIEPMLNNACGGCHFDGGATVPKDGFGYTSYAKLVGPVSADHTGCASLDASKRRVVPGHPENSLIYIKVTVQNPPAGCGGHMPYMGTNMSPENQASLKAWILAGAPQ
jgi:hypothetical protein